jgi:hypothetical protein
MADEILVSTRLKVVKGNLSLDRKIENVQVDMAGTLMDYRIHRIGINPQPLNISTDVMGRCQFLNVSNTTIYVGIVVDESGGSDQEFIQIVKCLPGEPNSMRFMQLDLYAMADAGSEDAELEVWVLEN